MAVKFSEMSALRVDLARNLEAGFDDYLEDVAEGYNQFVAPLLEEGETTPDIRFQLEVLKRGVVRGRKRLRSIGSGVIDRTYDGDKVRAEVQQSMDGVTEKLRQVRHFCRGMFGPAGVERVGLKKEPPRGAARLYEHGQAVKAGLENPDLGLEPGIEIETGEGIPSPQEQLAARLEPELSELGELVGDRHRKNRSDAALRSQQRRAIRDFDTDVRAIVRMAQGMFRLAGRDDLADRFRPLLRRVVRRINRAQTAEQETEAAEPAADPSTVPLTEPSASPTDDAAAAATGSATAPDADDAVTEPAVAPKADATTA